MKNKRKKKTAISRFVIKFCFLSSPSPMTSFPKILIKKRFALLHSPAPM